MAMNLLGGCLRLSHRGGLRLAGARHKAVIPASPARSFSLQHPTRCLSPAKLRQNREFFLNHGLLVNSNLLSSTTRLLATQNGPYPPRNDVQKTPKAVIFDLGGVVVPSPQPIFDRFEEQHDLKHGSLIHTIKAAGEDGAFAKLERGELTVEGVTEPYAADYKRVMGIEISVDLVQAFMRQLADFTKLTPHAEVIRVIEKLRSKGIKVAILTNNFLFDSGQRVFPQNKLENVDVVRILHMILLVDKATLYHATPTHTHYAHALSLSLSLSHTHTHSHPHTHTHIHVHVHIRTCTCTSHTHRWLSPVLRSSESQTRPSLTSLWSGLAWQPVRPSFSMTSEAT